jgi:hypothetical protein
MTGSNFKRGLGELDIALSDSRLGRNLFRLWVDHNAERRGVDPSVVEAALRRDTVEQLDIDSVRLIPIEKALKRAAMRDYAAAGRILRTYLVAGANQMIQADEARTGRRRSRAAAKEPRQDPLQEQIERIVAVDPKISAKKLLRQIEGMVGQGLIVDVDSAVITFAIGQSRNHRTASVQGLKDRLTRAKKKRKSR